MDPVIIGNATLYCADCMDVLPTLAQVDVTITDPPYGDVTHKGARTGGNGETKLVHFDCITQDQFYAICDLLVEKTNRWIVMTCEWRHPAKIEESGLPLVRLGVWIKPNGAPQFTGDRPGTGWEAIAILHREGKKRWNGGGHHAVWTANKENSDHPTGKPLVLVRDFVSKFSDPGESILDPFMGGGTTGVAAIQLGRKFIGIERDPKYFDIACKRIEQAVAQGQLFAPEPIKQVQEGLFV